MTQHIDLDAALAFMKHDPLCAVVGGYELPCDCGMHAAKDAFIDRLRKSEKAREGWKLVPVEPTEEMLHAADESDREYSTRNFGDGTVLCQGGYDHWVAMLAAAPDCTPTDSADSEGEKV